MDNLLILCKCLAHICMTDTPKLNAVNYHVVYTGFFGTYTG